MANCKFDNINDPLLRDFIKYYGQKSGMELFLKQVQKVENALYVNPNVVYSDTQRRNLLKKQKVINWHISCFFKKSLKTNHWVHLIQVMF